MRIMMVMADGFEDTEAIATFDVLKRAKLNVDLVSFGGGHILKSQYGLEVKANNLLKDVDLNDYKALVIPGGKAVANVLDKNEELPKIIAEFVESKRLVAAICAGPTQVGKLGFYKGHDYTCFPGSEKQITAGSYQPELGVVRSGNFITAKSMASAVAFGLEIVEFVYGKEQRETVRKAIFGE